jgi:YVTN family beta-propeller protein
MKRILGTALLAIGIALAALPARAEPTVYIPLGSANMVIAVSAATDRIVKTFTGVENPHGLVATPDGEYLVAGSLSETQLPQGAPPDSPNSKLFVIHPVHGHVMRTIPVPGWTHHQAIMPTGNLVISTHPTRGAISVVDLAANRVARVVKTGAAPNYSLVGPGGARLYVSNSGDGTISEIETGGWTVARTLQGGASPEHMVLSADGGSIYVASGSAGVVSVVSLDSGKVVREFQLGRQLHGLDMGDDGRTLFVTVISEEKLVALDPQSSVQREIALAPAPYHLGAIRGAGKLYVSSSQEPRIWVIDQRSLKVLGTIQLPAGEGHQIGVAR